MYIFVHLLHIDIVYRIKKKMVKIFTSLTQTTWENKLLIHEAENNKTYKQHQKYKKFSISIAYCMYKKSYIDNVYGT